MSSSRESNQQDTTKQECEQRIKKLRLYARVSLIAITALVLISAWLLLFFNAWLGLGLAAFTLLVYLLIVRRITGGYDGAMGEACVRYGIGSTLQELQCPAEKLTQEDFTAWQLLPLLRGPNSLLCNRAFTGILDDVSIYGCELTLHYPKAHGNRTEYEFISGTLFTTNHPANGVNGDWLLLRHGLVDQNALRNFLQECGYREQSAPYALAKSFDLYTHVPENRLPTAMAKRFVQIAQQYKSIVALRLMAKGAALFLRNRFYTGKYPASVSPQLVLEDHGLFPERDPCWSLLHTWAEYNTTL